MSNFAGYADNDTLLTIRENAKKASASLRNTTKELNTVFVFKKLNKSFCNKWHFVTSSKVEFGICVNKKAFQSM